MNAQIEKKVCWMPYAIAMRVGVVVDVEVGVE